ncbi:helix-turn-helix domain-containing protein [Paraclostridium bifermentans]|uniref:helix-turn-helix transcriptional regulator n=1 Tax=Paraclostridium bifermentans TaxID=1490 RepID=UPI001F3C549D|nr:helix-turn-helix domain-containing protein [Paraclostridium bifermentans]MCE9676590.1 helix-turn-helix domain-containing protein [Paraclostridium bifermentans]
MIQKNKLAAYRKLYELNQEDVAKMLNMSKTSYSYKETGKQEFRLNEAKMLADYFGTTIDEIFFNNSVNIKMTKIV